jgi:hypothetical protein
VCSRDAAETPHGASIKKRAKRALSQRSLKDRKWEKKGSRGRETIIHKVAGVRMKSCPKCKIKGEGGDTSAGEIEITRAMLTAVPPTQSAEQGETEGRESARARDKRSGKHTIFCLS